MLISTAPTFAASCSSSKPANRTHPFMILLFDLLPTSPARNDPMNTQAMREVQVDEMSVSTQVPGAVTRSLECGPTGHQACCPRGQDFGVVAFPANVAGGE